MPYKEPDNLNIFWLTILMFKDVLLGVVGGAIAYLFDFSKARRDGNAFAFQVSSMLINMALGGFVAYMVGSIVPADTTGRDAIIGLTGVTSYQILLLAESKFATWIFHKITGEKIEDHQEKKKDKK